MRDVVMAVAVVAIATGAAHATPAPRAPFLVFTPIVKKPGRITVVRETITIDCTKLPSEPCVVEMSQVLKCARGSSDTDGCVTNLDYPAGMGIKMEGRGSLLSQIISRAESDRRRVPQPSSHVMRSGKTSDSLEFGSGSEAILRLSGILEIRHLRRGGLFVIPAIMARHIHLNNYRNPTPSKLRIGAAPKATRHASYTLDLNVRFPRDWTLSSVSRVSVVRPIDPTPPVVHPGAKFVAALKAPAAKLTLTAETGGTGPWTGGIVIGLGGMLERGSEFRFRLGYEFAAPNWLLYSVNVDTNFTDDVVLAVHLEASLPSLVFLPMTLAAGVGLPVRVTKTPEVGVRFLVTLQVLVAAFNATFDVYPGRTSGGVLETTLSALIMF